STALRPDTRRARSFACSLLPTSLNFQPYRGQIRTSSGYTRLMAGKRTYGDRCGVARALDLLGDRWALLVVRELLLGPKRFTDLRAGLPNVGPDVLAQRLRELEQVGVVRRDTLPPPAASHVYELTVWGGELGPIVLALGRWGGGAPFP